jgi:hypothetical protein
MKHLYINPKQCFLFTKTEGLFLCTNVTPEPTKNNPDPEERYTQTHIANFTVADILVVDVMSNGVKIPSVNFSIQHINGIKSELFTVAIEKIEKIDWHSLNHRCVFNPTYRNGKECLSYILRASLPAQSSKIEYHLESIGTHIVDDTAIFFAGNEIINPEIPITLPNIKWTPISDTKLAFDPNCSEGDADAGMQRIIDLSLETGRVIASFNILNIMRKAFMVERVKPRCCLIVYGETGNKKTTYAAFQSQLYNRDVPLLSPPRLNASIAAAVNLLYEKNDCVVVLDDLYPAQDREIHRQQEKTLFEIIRIIGDGIEPARMRGHKIAKAPPQCGVLFTAEYYIGTGSDAARLLPIKMEKPIDNDKMTACQREPLMLSTFYRYFICWYITNFNHICGLLNEWVIKYRSTKTTVHPRLQETQFCLEAAYKLYLTYRLEKGYITRDEMLNQYNGFYQQLRDIVLEQDKRVKNTKGIIPTNTDYLKVIRSIYQEKRFRLVKNVKDFEVKEHDGIVHKVCVYFRQDKLMSKIRTFEPSAEFDDVLKCLISKQAFKKGSDSNSRKLTGSRLRFYAVPLDKLQ